MRKIINYLLLVLILVFVSTINVYAEPVTYERKPEENYGVKKEINITSNNLYNIKNTKLVDASEKVYDFADILTDEEEAELKQRIYKFIEDNNMDMVIVTDSFAYTSDKQNEVYADDFYDYNDFGMGFEYNSGVLLLRNANPQDPYYHMSTTGSAQLYLNDSRIDYILDNIYYDMRAGNYLSAFTKFINYTDNYIKSGKPASAQNYYLDKNGNMHLAPAKYHPPFAVAIIMGLLVAGITVSILTAKNKMVKKATEAKAYLDENSINIIKRIDKFLRSHTTHYTISSSSGGGGHSRGGHSFHHSSSGSSHGGGGRHG